VIPPSVPVRLSREAYLREILRRLVWMRDVLIAAAPAVHQMQEDVNRWLPEAAEIIAPQWQPHPTIREAVAERGTDGVSGKRHVLMAALAELPSATPRGRRPTDGAGVVAAVRALAERTLNAEVEGKPVPTKAREHLPEVIDAVQSRVQPGPLALLLRREGQEQHYQALWHQLKRPRERACLELLAQRLAAGRPIIREEVAAELGVTRSTLDGYISTIHQAARAVAGGRGSPD
jgi:DNA-binding CsgD family transcriptional regulator